jgi:hypothetical protein
MTNIDTYIKALQIKWILRLLENSNENWKIIPQKYFEKIGENFLIFNMNLDSFKSLLFFSGSSFLLWLYIY